jgi:hypothetical protein
VKPSPVDGTMAGFPLPGESWQVGRLLQLACLYSSPVLVPCRLSGPVRLRLPALKLCHPAFPAPSMCSRMPHVSTLRSSSAIAPQLESPFSESISGECRLRARPSMPCSCRGVIYCHMV